MYPLIIGDSHSIYLARSFGDFGEQKDSSECNEYPRRVVRDGKSVAEVLPTLLPNDPFFMSDTQKIWINEKFASVLVNRETEWSHCLLSLDGNYHNAHFMQQKGVPFDFFDETIPSSFIRNACIVPRAAVIDFFSNGLIMLGRKFQLILPLFKSLDVHFVAPPPPIPSEEQIAKFPEIFKLNEFPLNPAFFRLKIYRAYVETLENICRSYGVGFIHPPQSCLDENGFLAESYWAHCTHANPEYYHYISRQPFLREGKR